MRNSAALRCCMTKLLYNYFLETYTFCLLFIHRSIWLVLDFKNNHIDYNFNHLCVNLHSCRVSGTFCYCVTMTFVIIFVIIATIVIIIIIIIKMLVITILVIPFSQPRKQYLITQLAPFISLNSSPSSTSQLNVVVVTIFLRHNFNDSHC